uniref:Uncharacterized protein n=1 Tax=Setaria italica TaxID=4555 RepID=K3ZBQ6_SETIT
MAIVSVYHRQCKQRPKALLPSYFRSMQALNKQGTCYLSIDFFFCSVSSQIQLMPLY